MSVSSATIIEENLAKNVEEYRIAGLVRVPLDKIGFWPGNRDSTGINGRLLMQIAEDIVTNGTSLRRYYCVDLVEIPAAKLGLFLRFNKTQCDRGSCTPLFNPDMEYVLLTKTHFTFAHMLIRDGGRTLYNFPNMQEIKLKPGDREGHRIQELGVLASIIDSELFWDDAAMWSYATQDNLR